MLLSDVQTDQKRRNAWQGLTDKTLSIWLDDPSEIADEGFDAPSRTIIRLSFDLSEHLMNQKMPAPDSIIPDPNGGIVFERQEGDVTEAIHVWDDGNVEYTRFKNSNLEERCPYGF